jgi:hypothetical protein
MLLLTPQVLLSITSGCSVFGHAPAATWLLVYCIVACVTTWRDNNEAKYCQQFIQQGDQPDGNINRCVLAV